MDPNIKDQLIEKKKVLQHHIMVGKEASENLPKALHKKQKRRLRSLIRRGERAQMRLLQFRNMKLD